MRKIAEQKGFSIIEVTIYFTVFSIVFFAIMSFSVQIMLTNTKAGNIQDIQSNMGFMVNKLMSNIKTAEDVDTGNNVFDNDIGTISLNMSDAGKSPTLFYLLNEAIYMKQGASTAVKISSNTIKCTRMRFQRVTSTKAPDQIILDTSCEPKYITGPNLANELEVHTSVTLR